MGKPLSLLHGPWRLSLSLSLSLQEASASLGLRMSDEQCSLQALPFLEQPLPSLRSQNSSLHGGVGLLSHGSPYCCSRNQSLLLHNSHGKTNKQKTKQKNKQTNKTTPVIKMVTELRREIRVSFPLNPFHRFSPQEHWQRQSIQRQPVSCTQV